MQGDTHRIILVNTMHVYNDINLIFFDSDICCNITTSTSHDPLNRISIDVMIKPQEEEEEELSRSSEGTSRRNGIHTKITQGEKNARNNRKCNASGLYIPMYN